MGPRCDRAQTHLLLIVIGVTNEGTCADCEKILHERLQRMEATIAALQTSADQRAEN